MAVLGKQATSPSAFARESPAASSPGDAGSPFALAEVADGCAAAGLRPRTRSRSLLSDKMAEQGGQPEVRFRESRPSVKEKAHR